MARIDDLIPKLKDQAKAESDMFSGKESREYFVETLSDSFGVKSVDDLLDRFDPTEHNEKWDAERQKPAPDPEEIMLNRRAIAFMTSCRRDLHRHYAMTELTARMQGVNRMKWAHNVLDQTKYFTSMKSVKKS
jgi:hypothetical protein